MKKLLILIALFNVIGVIKISACDESTWFFNKEIREKKQFIRDFIAHPDSITEPAFYAKYKYFRIRNGFIEDNRKTFNYKPVIEMIISYMQENYKFGANQKWISYADGRFVHIITIHYLGSPKNNEDKGYPTIQFYWVCKSGEWVLTEIRFDYSELRSLGTGTPTDFENW